MRPRVEPPISRTACSARAVLNRSSHSSTGRAARRAGLPVDLWDERFTTARALHAVREMGGRTAGRKEDLDALSAALILQHYLDARRGSAT